MKKIFYILAVVLFITSCGSKKGNYTIISKSGTYIPVLEANRKDENMVRLVDSYKTVLDKEMNQVIAHAAADMTTGRPESLLTNLTADWMRELNNEYTEGRVVDIAFMNVHGIRAPIAKGEITVGAIFAAYPFDNLLSVARLQGKYVTNLFESYARLGGAGVSGNVKLTIRNKELIEALVDGKPVDDEKIYTIVTLDYLAEGNDGMQAITNAVSIVGTGIKLREYMLMNVRKAEAEGKQIAPVLDGRICIVE